MIKIQCFGNGNRIIMMSSFYFQTLATCIRHKIAQIIKIKM